MSETAKLVASARETFGKGVARKLRAAGKTPVVVYGHGAEPLHLSVETHPLSLIVRHANALIELDIEGKKQLVLVKDVQKNPLLQVIEHVDLLIVKRGEKVSVEVPLVVLGADERADRIVVMDQQTIVLEAEATHIPASVEIDVTNLEIGDSIAAKDLNLPEGAVFPGEPDDLILSITAAKTQEQLDAELAGSGDEAEAEPVEAAAEAE